MSEEILLSFEGHRERTAIATYLRQLADGLAGDGTVTFSEGDESVTLMVPENPEFEVEIEREQEDDEAEYEIELELEWSTADAAGDDLTIEAGGADEASEAADSSSEDDESAAPTTPTADDEQETIEESVEDAGGQADDEASQPDEKERTDGGAPAETRHATTPTVVSITKPDPQTGQFECYTDRRGEHRWRLRRADGQTLAIGTKGHESPEAAEAEIDEVKALVGRAEVTDGPME